MLAVLHCGKADGLVVAHVEPLRRLLTTQEAILAQVWAAGGRVFATDGAGEIVLVTQRWADRRESIAWAWERQREVERWSREDEARTFEHRRKAYLDFYVAVKGVQAPCLCAIPRAPGTGSHIGPLRKPGT